MAILQPRQPSPPATKFGILLAPQWQPPHAPSSNSLSSSLSPSPNGSISSSSSSSSASSYTSLSTNDHAAVLNYPSSALSPNSRRIRFAPLPDPRRSLTDDGDELSIPDFEDPTQLSCPATPIAQAASLEPDQPFQDNSSLSSCCSSKRNSDYTDPYSSSSTPGTATPASSFMTPPASECDSSISPSPVAVTASLPTLQKSSKPSSSWSKPKSLSLLRPFKKSSGSSSSSSSLSLTPTPSVERKSEDNRTLNGINIFRTSSLDSNRGNGQSGGGWGLSRLSSTGTAKTNGLSGSSPLARTQSTQSYKSNSAKPPSMNAKRGSTGGLFSSASASTKPLIPSRKGTRMLNGRVYGGPKRDPNANPFANARDEEPEFVEWGYGGMGSVKGARSAGVSGTNWDRLHGNGSVSIGSVDGAKSGGVGGQQEEDENGDDGSGMGWVKKRREKKEREEKERREKEEREKLEQESGQKVTDDSVPISDELDPGTTTNSNNSTDRDPSEAPIMATAELSAPASDPVPTSAHETMARPTTPASTATATGVVPLSSPVSTSPTVEKEHILQTVSVPTRTYHHHRGHSRSGSRDTMPLSLSSGGSVTSPKLIEEAPNSSSSASESESESDPEDIGEEDADAEDDDEEEDDMLELEERRKTAFSAGVEKISRFKELASTEDPNRA